ncbi:hypothetical protein [Anaeromyxobacter sp. SG17]|uniref:hypothetical protein n=1 Tax=Anaeromyxobacter sp. SG17 TaxID=2925405 RepID=UPI001F58E2DC|nr:hypothetical protein [Anaeromyxobacter sp. SG17]
MTVQAPTPFADRVRMLGLMRSRFRVNFVAATAATAATVALTALSYPVYLSYAGYERFGVWLLVSTVLSLAQLTSFGIGPAVTYMVAQEHRRGALLGVASIIRGALALVTATGLVAGAGLVLFGELLVSGAGIAGASAVQARQAMPFVAVLTIGSLWLQVLASAVSGLRRLDLSVGVDTAGRVVAFAFTATLLWRGGGLVSFLVGTAVGQVCMAAAYVQCIRRHVPFRSFSAARLEWDRIFGMLRISSGVFGGSVLVLLLHPFNRVLVSRFVGVAAVPVLEIGFNSAMQFRSLFEAGFRAITPEISRSAALPGPESLERAKDVCLNGRRLVLLLGAPAWIAAALAAGPIFDLWLGDRFEPGIPAAFRIVAVGAFASLLVVPSYYALLGLARTRQIFVHHFVQSALNVLGGTGLVLIRPQITVLGVASVVTVSMLGGSLYLWAQERRLLPAGDQARRWSAPR